MNRWSRLYHGDTRIDFIGRRRLWLTLSAVLLTVCAALLIFKGLNYGIEFEGGIQIKAGIAPDGPLGEASDAELVSEVGDTLEGLGASDAQIQVETSSDGERTVLVQSKDIADPQTQEQAVAAVEEAVGATDSDNERVGSTWGGEITDKAVRALVIFLIVVLAFMAWRFEWKMAVAAVIALVHDTTITAGVYSFIGFEVTPSTVIAILTILGYSLYDTVVVFDKVEENADALAATGRMTYQDSANLALNQVFMRSLNTSLATLLPVGALLFVGTGLFGASTLEDLALALFVGLLIGAYSSVFVATPLLSMWKENEPKYRIVRERLAIQEKRARDAEDGKRDKRREEAAVGASEAAGQETAVATRTAAGGGGAPRPGTPRPRSKKAKRRRRR